MKTAMKKGKKNATKSLLEESEKLALKRMQHHAEQQLIFLVFFPTNQC